MDGGERPAYGDFPEPQATAGTRVVEVRAAALSGLDRAIARRLHYLKMPDGPFVVGREGVARDGAKRIYFTVNAPVGPFGSMAERTLIDPKFSFPVPDAVADDVAAALGEAALEVLALHGRLVHVGTMAGQSMTVRGAAIRRTSADIMGFAYYHAPTDVQAQAYGELCRLAAAGELALDIETRPLAQIAAAWDARAAGNRRRQVLIP